MRVASALSPSASSSCAACPGGSPGPIRSVAPAACTGWHGRRFRSTRSGSKVEWDQRLRARSWLRLEVDRAHAWAGGHLQGGAVLQAQRLQRMTDGWVQVRPVLEGGPQLCHMRPASILRFGDQSGVQDVRQSDVRMSTSRPMHLRAWHWRSQKKSISVVVTTWFDLHMTARSVSDLNNICFVTDALKSAKHAKWQWRHGSGT